MMRGGITWRVSRNFGRHACSDLGRILILISVVFPTFLNQSRWRRLGRDRLAAELWWRFAVFGLQICSSGKFYFDEPSFRTRRKAFTDRSGRKFGSRFLYPSLLGLPCCHEQ
jgi:hypothetical protein